MRGLVAILVSGITLARLAVVSDPFDHVWAEDGAVFLRDAEVDGLGAIDHRFAGYLHVVARVIAALGTALPLSSYATYVAIASAVVAGLLAAFVFSVALGVLGSREWALVAALAIALAPPLRGESLANLANLHWLLLYAAFWAMLASGPARGASGVALLATLSSPLTVLVAPAAFVAHGRNAWRRRPVIAVAVGAAIQGVAMLFAPSSTGGPDRDVGFNDAIATSLVRDVLGAAHGPSALRYLVGFVVAGVLAWGWRSAAGDSRRLSLAAWGTGLAVYLVSCVITGLPQMRYVALASLFVFAGFALLGPRLRPAVALAGIAVLGALVLEGLPASSFRESGPSWSEGVAAHEAACIRGEQRPIPLSPERFGGVAQVPCE
ncbi:MAG TPA: hypothetical protein VFZ89_10930 [Solirubrobacteraceae bacterium]